MPLAPSKKAENLRAEVKKLQDTATKKLRLIDKSENERKDNNKKEIHQISMELERFKKKTEDVMNGCVEGSGWDEQAILIGERMKLMVEQESQEQHHLLLKTDEATKELELKVKPIKKEIPLVSDFSEEDRVWMMAGIDKVMKNLKQKRESFALVEAKLDKQMQALMEYTPDPTEDKQTILRKLQMSFDVVSGANDPDKARESLLREIDSFGLILPKKNLDNKKNKSGQGGASTSNQPRAKTGGNN